MLKPVIGAVLALLITTDAAAQEKVPPYWASISAGRVRRGAITSST